MDSVNNITRDEFIRDCTNKLQTGRMLGLSALFTPFWNTYNFFPQIQINDIKNIRNKVNENDIQEAQKIFIEICVKRYISCGPKFRQNCIHIIKNIGKDPLMSDEHQVNAIQKEIISQLLVMYTKTNNDVEIKDLKNHFPDIEIGKKEEHGKVTKNNMIEILNSGKSCKQDVLVEQATLQLVGELCENSKSIDISRLQNQLALLEKVGCEEEKIQKVVALLLTKYFFDKKGIIYMVSGSESEYSRNNLIVKYNISLSLLIPPIKSMFFSQRRSEGKIKILLNSFSAKERESCEEGMDFLYDVFNENYRRSTYEICSHVLEKVNLEKRYKDIEEKKEFIYDNESKYEKKNKLSRADEMIRHGQRREAIQFAYTLCREGNYYNLSMVYQKIYNQYRHVLDRLPDLEEVLKHIEASEVKGEKDLVKNLAIAIITLYLDYATTDTLGGVPENYIQKYHIQQQELEFILTNNQIKFLTKAKDETTQDYVSYTKHFFAYIDKFPGVSQDQKKLQKTSLLIKINKAGFTIDAILHREARLHQLKNAIKDINQTEKDLPIELAIPQNLTIVEKFVVLDMFDIRGKSQEIALKQILDDMLDSNQYVAIMPLVEKIGAQYGALIKPWAKKVLTKATELKDFAYAETLLHTYESEIGGAEARKSLEEKNILEEITIRELHQIKITKIGFSLATTEAFTDKLHSTSITTSNIDFFINIFQQQDVLLPKLVKTTADKKLLEYFNQKSVTPHQYRYVHYLLTTNYQKLSEYHFGAGKRLYDKYKSTKEHIEAISLCEEMIIFAKALENREKSEKYVALRETEKRRTVKNKYDQDYDILSKSIQLLRPLPGGLYKDTEATLQTSEIAIKIQKLYDFAIHYGIDKKYIQKILQLWKDFYVYTQNTEGLNSLKTLYGIERYTIDELKNQLATFLDDRNNLGVQQLQELILFFGMENAADILFQLYPQYRPLGVLFIKSILSQYLGNFLLQRNGLHFVAIPEILQLGSKEMVDRIYTVTEKGFLNYYTKAKKKSSEIPDSEICEQYLIYAKQEFEKIRLHEPVFDDILKRFRVFLDQILAIKKADCFIDKLQSGRDFPDFLQKLNAAEIKSKRRFLIADGMGMGKSLSAILAKESIGAKNCLVVTPSNVVDTWKNYLSDINIPNKKKQGYFATGKAPKVLVVQSYEDIHNTTLQDYEYIIISQEKLSSDTYLQPLVETNFDYMIVDEIHKLKNVSKGKRANALLHIAEKIEQKDGFLCLLSGTPIPNKVGDIAMLLKLLYPHEYGNIDNRELIKSILAGDTLNLRTLLLPRMQMKKITDHIDMPELYNTYETLHLSEKEQFYYDTVLADDEMSASEKIIKLRQFILNPRLLGITDIPVSSKAKNTGEAANTLFKEKNKVVFFVNSFINGILRPTESISDQEIFITQMGLDSDIEIRIIDGETKQEERAKIQEEFNSSQKKIALFVSGATADVGIDLTGGEHIIHINEPRTQADKDQQEARVYRPGQNKDIETTTYITNSSIEQGIHEYVKLKQDAIMKLYYGIELSVLEKRILESDDPGTSAETGSEKEINKGLSTYFRESAKELNNMYGYLKQAGSSNVETLVLEHGEKFAGYYKALGPRSYQANTNRLNASIIKQLIVENHFVHPNIVDIGSGPKMLYHHISDELKQQVISVDINPHHFTQEDISSGKAKIGNFLSLPCETGSVDIISSSLAFNETSRDPKQGNYERLSCLLEIQRALKKGGYAVISTIYSLQYKEKENLIKILHILGFEMCDTYSGVAESKDRKNMFHAKTITIRKIKDNHNPLDYILHMLKEENLLDGLSMKEDKIYLKNQKNVLNSVEIGEATIPIELNKEGKTTLSMENAYTEIIEKREHTYGSIEKIPNNIIREYGFARYSSGKSRVLCMSLPNNAGLFTYRKPIKKI